MNVNQQSYLYTTAAGAQWQKIGAYNHHGIVVPLFSLHSKTSGGIGEYPDLLPLISWSKNIGFDIIQLLPLNDTGQDSSPYSAISAYALNPIHLNIDRLSDAEQLPNFKKRIEALHALSVSQRINYPAVQNQKNEILREYESCYGKKIRESVGYQEFKKNNANWLRDYGVFKALKVMQHWKNWEEWEPDLRNPSPDMYERLTDEVLAEADFHMMLQFLCFQQLHEVKQAASKLGVFIKGDIPILINRDSADVWSKRHLFKLDLAAGAPPDMYAAEGQKWGFPLYNWEAMTQEQNVWWINRLAFAENFYHIYRIDHIVGFFRIWGVPLERLPKEGHFVPEDRSTWIPQGTKLMKMMLDNCSMLPIGEDLGTVPPEVRDCLRSLGICGTKVMRWEKRWNEDQGFIDPKDYPLESMTTVSTHDSETLEIWWRDQKEEAKAYAHTLKWHYHNHITQKQRQDVLLASHHSKSLFHINLLQEYFALVPRLSWSNPRDERINVPGVVSIKNWSYRFRPSVEEIVSNLSLKQAMTEMIVP